MLRTGWKPARPDRWQANETTAVVVTQEPFTKFQVLARAHVDLQRRTWEQAAKHEHGVDLESGIHSFEAVRQGTKYLRKHGCHREAKALEYVMVGFYHDPTDDDEPHVILCKRCARGCRATRYHKTYECEDNQRIDAEVFRKTQWILTRAKKEAQLHVVLWMRGLIPASLLRRTGEVEVYDA